MNFPRCKGCGPAIGPNQMDEWPSDGKNHEMSEEESIEHALLQMDILYRTRCVQSPFSSNVTISEIDTQDE